MSQDINDGRNVSFAIPSGTTFSLVLRVEQCSDCHIEFFLKNERGDVIDRDYGVSIESPSPDQIYVWNFQTIHLLQFTALYASNYQDLNGKEQNIYFHIRVRGEKSDKFWRISYADLTINKVGKYITFIYL